MEGSPVRSQQKVPLVQLNESHNLQDFQTEIIRHIALEVRHAEVFFAVVDANTKILQLPAWIKSHLEQHPSLQKKLEQGEMVGISAVDDTATARPATAARSSIVLIPIIHSGRLSAGIGLISTLEGPQFSQEDIEAARQFAYDAAPILARLQDIERLQGENRDLRGRAERSEQYEEALAGILEDKNTLDAILQMRSHQQINVAHELRTPLAAIRGYVRMIQDGRAGEINDTQRDYLRIVTENTNRLITLVSWMSYVAELSAHHLKPTEFDFRDIWAECIKAGRPAFAQKSLKLTQSIAEEPFLMIGDREKLSYVLDELLAAAVKLADTGGTITAQLSHSREGEVSFKLSQTGETISPDVLRKIFDRPFNAVTKPTAQPLESGAISLSGVYDVVGMHGGRVFVNSTAGRGATFLFTLPTVSVEEEKNHEQAVNSSRRRR